MTSSYPNIAGNKPRYLTDHIDPLKIALAVCRAGFGAQHQYSFGAISPKGSHGFRGSYIGDDELSAIVWKYAYYAKVRLTKADVESIVHALPAALDLFSKGVRQ